MDLIFFSQITKDYQLLKMARGQQKIQSQQKNAKRAADAKKGNQDTRAAASVKLTVVCKTCKVCFFDKLYLLIINFNFNFLII